jgi:hypothetical protein
MKIKLIGRLVQDGKVIQLVLGVGYESMHTFQQESKR